ncbi:MAG: siroheme synthase CysG [Steroidobacteraceae bacterium]
MKYFPVFFDLDDQPVLIVGGGKVALRKLLLLEAAGARITVVAPAVHPDISDRAGQGSLTLIRREFQPQDLDGRRLVIIATSRRAVNRWIAQIADGRGIPANVVDDREASRFIVPAIIDRDPVTIAVSTGGTSPVLARRLRERLEALVPGRIGELARWLADLRRQALDRLRDSADRRRYFEDLVDGPAARRFMDGDRKGAERIARQQLALGTQAPPPRGEVTLVGAGPGDPELLTLKALRALQDADVVLHDRLVSPAVLELSRRDAVRISVGKEADGPSTPQQRIHELLIEHARAGRRVVRLKGGDPFIFGRGGEELQALAAAGIPFSVIPGISAALGGAAYAGIPLTHREHAHAVSFVTGHAGPEGQEPDWRAFAKAGHTVVFYMGLSKLAHISERLRAHGAPSTRPVALVAQATLPSQRVAQGTLADIAGIAVAANIESPALLIVGDVAALGSVLGWFNPASLEEERHLTA